MESDISLENYNKILKHNFDSEFDSWAGRTSDMNSIDTGYVYNHLKDKKKKDFNYKAKNIDFQKQLGDSVKYVGELRGKYDDAVMMKDEIVQINNATELHGNNWSNFKLSKAGQDVASVVGGKTPARLEEGVLGYDIDGVFMSTFDIRKMINNSTLDRSSKDVLDGMVEYYKTQAQGEMVGEPDMNEIRNRVDSEIVSKGNIYSLKNDKIIETEGGSFINDFVSNLQSLTYGDLGISQDATKDKNNISADEAMAMASGLGQDENLEKEQLVNYFATHVYMQYERERGSNPSAVYAENQDSNDTSKATLYKKGSL